MVGPDLGRGAAIFTFVAGCWLAAGCAGTPTLGPEIGLAPRSLPDSRSGAASGITVVGVADEWRYSPGNLPDHVTPVRVKVTNNRSEPVLLTLEDATLIDDRGLRRIALPPGDAVQRAARTAGEASVGPGIRPSVSISQGIGVGGMGISIGGLGMGSGPFGAGPGAESENDVEALEVGLRPGRLDPGASVDGYLFFESPLQPAERARRFRVIWDIRPVTAVGAPLAPPIFRAEVPLVAR
ncbi:MAG: hypothetical protein Q8R92_17490 [Deltaproteobacteria bacterium]|nr:hypothetical protein [Deltaproteobacteria bacterium]